MNGDHSWLDSYEPEYRPEHAFRAGIDTLPDGDYEMSVIDQAFDSAQGKRIFRLGLRTASGAVVERTYWIEDQRNLNALCADLLLLGFDADRWGRSHGRPLSVELPKAAARLVGIRFRARKTTRPDTRQGKQGSYFHDLHIAGRVPASDRSGTETPFSGSAAATPQQPAPRVPASAMSDIPF